MRSARVIDRPAVRRNTRKGIEKSDALLGAAVVVTRL
jgi:hypothetical protein